MMNIRELLQTRPLLFDGAMNPKAAYYGALQDDSVPDIE